MVTAYDENAPPTLTSLKSSQWNGTKVKVRTAGKTLGKTVRVFKYGNGWIHATLNMNKPVGDLTIDDDSVICTRANELQLEMENAGSYWDDGEEEEVSLPTGSLRLAPGRKR